MTANYTSDLSKSKLTHETKETITAATEQDHIPHFLWATFYPKPSMCISRLQSHQDHFTD